MFALVSLDENHRLKISQALNLLCELFLGAPFLSANVIISVEKIAEIYLIQDELLL